MLEKVKIEAEKIKAEFKNSDPHKLTRWERLIEQAAVETVILHELNEQALKTGVVKIHPDNPSLQKALPVSKAITQHAASLANIMDKLEKHLAVEVDEDEEGLDDYI